MVSEGSIVQYQQKHSRMSEAKIIRLAANENCYGCSPFAMDAVQKNLENIHLYPEVNPVVLKDKLAESFGVNSKNIVVGAGSVRIIDGLIQTFVGAEEEVLTFEKSFIAYGQLAGFHNRKCQFAPLTEFRCNPENIFPLINEKTKLIFIANPNNPTGTIISHDELENLLGRISKNIIVAIDEAYGEYVNDSAFPNSIALQKKYPNLVILHSFSKIYGLAGLRIGFAIMDEEKAASMSRGQIPYSLSPISVNAALAALNDQAFILKSAKDNAEQRTILFNELNKLGYNVVASQSNFIYMWFGTDDEKKMVYDKLFRNGIIICDMKIFGQEKALRISIGDAKANAMIIQCLG